MDFDLTSSSTSGLEWPAVVPTEKRPPVILTSFTERSMSVFGAGAAGDFGGSQPGSPPSLEKFHSPLGDWMIAMAGRSMVKPVTWSCRDAISGQTSTPMASDLACTNGVRL